MSDKQQMRKMEIHIYIPATETLTDRPKIVKIPGEFPVSYTNTDIDEIVEGVVKTMGASYGNWFDVVSVEG